MHPAERQRRKYLARRALLSGDYSLDRQQGIFIVKIPRKRGAPYGNRNAIGNNGGAPLGNLNAQRRGLYTNLRYRWTMSFIEQRLFERGTWNKDEFKEIAKVVKTDGLYIPLNLIIEEETKHFE